VGRAEQKKVERKVRSIRKGTGKGSGGSEKGNGRGL
jgi:hypothetical protein